jgi:hypothetical protein
LADARHFSGAHSPHILARHGGHKATAPQGVKADCWLKVSASFFEKKEAKKLSLDGG